MKKVMAACAAVALGLALSAAPAQAQGKTVIKNSGNGVGNKIIVNNGHHGPHGPVYTQPYISPGYVMSGYVSPGYVDPYCTPPDCGDGVPVLPVDNCVPVYGVPVHGGCGNRGAGRPAFGGKRADPTI